MAGLVAYEIEASANLEELNASRFLYKNSNQGLLAGSEVMGAATTTSGCLSSRRIMSATAPCSPMAWLSQWPGRPAMIAEVPLTNKQAFAAVNIEIDIYLGRSEACGADQYSPSQWGQTIKNLGVLRAYIREVLFLFAISGYDDAIPYQAMNLWQETRDKDALMNAKVYNLLMNTGAKGKGRGGRQAVRGHEDHGRGRGHQADGGAIGSPIGRG